MRLCLICTEKLPVPPVRGGAIQIYLAGVLPHLAQHHDVTVVCRTDPALPDREQCGAVRYVRLPAGPVAGTYYGHVAEFLASEHFDLIELFNRPAFLVPLAAAAPGARFVLSLHNEMLGPDHLSEEAGAAALACADAVVTISEYIARTVAKQHPASAHKLKTIRSGVDLKRFRPHWEAADRRRLVRERIGLADRDLVLHVSRFSPKKGNHLVLEAMAEVRRTNPRADLLLVGSRRYGSNEPDEYTADLFDRAALLGAGVHFTGFIVPERLPDLFLAGDLFVCASQWPEPLARVHYEAMAAGLPIITTDRGGNGEVVHPAVNGLFATPYDDPAAFADCIRRLLDAPGCREGMGRAGRAQVEAHHTWDHVARALLEVFACTVS